MKVDDNVDMTGLFVAVVALVIASAQFLQAMFGTADGYRRCQDSVIGPWSRRTRLSWRWSQFRFETKFTTPQIIIYDKDMAVRRKGSAVSLTHFGSSLREVFDIGDDSSSIELMETFESHDPYLNNFSRAKWWFLSLRSGLLLLNPKAVLSALLRSSHSVDSLEDQVSWIKFLRNLHIQQVKSNVLDHDSTTSSDTASNIGVLYLEHTWDLMTPEITRPLATSTLGDLIVVAHRLGMRWLDLRLNEGFMRAEGNGHNLTSTLARGVGPVFQYTNDLREVSVTIRRRNGEGPATERVSSFDVSIPNALADKMACGIIPGDGGLGLLDSPVTGATLEESRDLVRVTFLKYGVAHQQVEALTQMEIINQIWTIPIPSPSNIALSDLLALASPFVPGAYSHVNRIVYPMRCLQVTSTFLGWEFRRVLLRRLEDSVALPGKDTPHLRDVLFDLTALSHYHKADFSCEWDEAMVSRRVRDLNDLKDKRITDKSKFLRMLRSIHGVTDRYFQSPNNVNITAIIGAHITATSVSFFEASKEKNPRNLTGDRFGAGPHDFLREYAHTLVDNLDLIVRRTNEILHASEQIEVKSIQIEEAWWTLVLRGIVWYMSVWITVPNYSVPS